MYQAENLEGTSLQPSVLPRMSNYVFSIENEKLNKMEKLIFLTALTLFLRSFSIKNVSKFLSITLFKV